MIRKSGYRFSEKDHAQSKKGFRPFFNGRLLTVPFAAANGRKLIECAG
jgi:hypothetical protein